MAATIAALHAGQEEIEDESLPWGRQLHVQCSEGLAEVGEGFALHVFIRFRRLHDP